MKQRSLSAFSLIELTLAIGIAAFCLLAVMGLIPIAVQTTRNATSQTAATNIIPSVIADMRATTSVTSPQYGITFGTCRRLYFDSQGQVVASSACNANITLPATARYRLTADFPPNPPAGLSYSDLKVTWPAPVDPATTTPAGSVEMFAAFDRN